jgi:hypothetical protein
LSILTKIFIILLTLSSLFLCGFVVQYVAYAENYKKLFSDAKGSVSKLENERKGLSKQLEDEITNRQSLTDSKDSQIALLQARINELQDSARKLDLDKTALQTQIDKIQSENTTLAAATKVQTNIADSVSKELTQVKSDLITEKKKYDEVAGALLEKENLINILQNDAKRLLEEKTSLEKKLGKFMQPYGQKAVPEQPITPERDKAQPVQTATTPATAVEISLKAKVTAVDMKNSLAKISIGQADGVRKGMRFHISRGGEYICDILIIDVAAEEAVGSLELVQKEPRQGDSADTNL